MCFRNMALKRRRFRGQALSCCFTLPGMLATFFWHVASAFRMFRLLDGAKREQLSDGSVLVLHRREAAPFSWMKFVVMSEKDWRENGKVILLHEEAHVRLYHSYDLLFAGLLACVQWFNPAVWWLRRELQVVHEYEADESGRVWRSRCKRISVCC